MVVVVLVLLMLVVFVVSNCSGALAQGLYLAWVVGFIAGGMGFSSSTGFAGAVVFGECNSVGKCSGVGNNPLQVQWF
ncbi:hypothetical protein U1Q18_032848 [Sarracenia purpurea var. burkii]